MTYLAHETTEADAQELIEDGLTIPATFRKDEAVRTGGADSTGDVVKSGGVGGELETSENQKQTKDQSSRANAAAAQIAATS